MENYMIELADVCGRHLNICRKKRKKNRFHYDSDELNIDWIDALASNRMQFIGFMSLIGKKKMRMKLLNTQNHLD